MREAWWHAFECINHPCVERHAVAVDVRVDGPPGEWPEGATLPCPVCGGPMDWGERWPADRWGYGSRGNWSALKLWAWRLRLWLWSRRGRRR